MTPCKKKITQSDRNHVIDSKKLNNLANTKTEYVDDISQPGAHYACLRQTDLNSLSSLDELQRNADCSTDSTQFKRILNETIRSYLARIPHTTSMTQIRLTAEKISSHLLKGTALTLKKTRVCLCDDADRCNNDDFAAFRESSSAPSLTVSTFTLVLLFLIVSNF